MKSLPIDIIKRIQTDFGSQATQVQQQLEDFVEKNDYHESHRITRAIIFIAEADIQKIATYIKAAETDYRDVLWWSEYNFSEGKENERIRDFSKIFGEENF